MTPRKPETVDPTPEIQARRKAAFGDEKAQLELDCLIDRAYGRKWLSEEQRFAGKYAIDTYWRYYRSIGGPVPSRGKYESYIQSSGGGEPMDPDSAAKATKAYFDMVTAIRRYSFTSLKEVERVMRGTPPRNFDALAVGLTALADYLGYRERTAA